MCFGGFLIAQGLILGLKEGDWNRLLSALGKPKPAYGWIVYALIKTQIFSK